MKQLLEFIPLIIFFVVYKNYDIYVATKALMAATAVTFIFTYIKEKKVGKMQIITTLMIFVFGSFTVFFHNDAFIKWKVTFIYALFALALLASQYLFKKPIIKQMLGKELTLPDNIWSRLNVAWALFFIVLSVLNIYIAFNLPQEVWVNFKVFGLMGATLVFTLISGLYIYKFLPTPEAAPTSKTSENEAIENDQKSDK